MKLPPYTSIKSDEKSETITIKGLNPISVGFGIVFCLLGIGLTIIEPALLIITVFGIIILSYQLSLKTSIRFFEKHFIYNKTKIQYSIIKSLGTTSNRRNTSIRLESNSPKHSMSTIQKELRINFTNNKTLTLGSELTGSQLKFVIDKIMEHK